MYHLNSITFVIVCLNSQATKCISNVFQKKKQSAIGDVHFFTCKQNSSEMRSSWLSTKCTLTILKWLNSKYFVLNSYSGFKTIKPWVVQTRSLCTEEAICNWTDCLLRNKDLATMLIHETYCLVYVLLLHLYSTLRQPEE